MMARPQKVLLDALGLMLQSGRHRDFYLKDLERLIIPAIEAGRLRVFYSDVGTPEGMYTHLFLTPEAERGYLTGTRKIQPQDWETEPEEGRLWVIDFIAPFGNAPKLVRLAQEELTDKYSGVCEDARWRRSLKGGHPRRVPFKVREHSA
jgi:hemolysin-activating ACP:hemolysin acyltransferase